MAGSFGVMVFMIMLAFPMAMSRMFATADAENHSPAFESAGPHGMNSGGEFFKGKMSFDEEWKSDAAPSTCTCTCYGGGASPKTPSQRSPIERKRSPPPPPAPYWPSPSSDAPNTKSPVSFTSPPPPAAPYDVPSYEQPSPVVGTSPQTFVPSPPPPVY